MLRGIIRDPEVMNAIVNKEDIAYFDKQYPPINASEVGGSGESETQQLKNCIKKSGLSELFKGGGSYCTNPLLDESDLTYSFEIMKPQVEIVRRRCIELDYPFMEEYDFLHDDINPNLDIDLSPKTSIRDYQEKSLGKIFGGDAGRARSGTIVLPTGAGKTLVGITAACTIKKSTLVLCTNAYASASVSH